MLDRCAEEPLVRLDGFVEVDDGDAEMMDPARLHTRAIVSARCYSTASVS